MRDILILGFVAFMVIAAFMRPFLASMAYIYVDLVSPQRITYYLLNSVPFSMIMAVLAVLLFVIGDNKQGIRIGRIQVVIIGFIVWFTLMTFFAALPQYAWVKWDTAWKSLGFAAFLPLVLQNRQRIETAILFIILSIGVITITGGVKTLAGGGGYGSINLLINNNSGLYESSTISTVAITVIPLILYIYRNSLLFPPSKLLWLACAGLILSALLIPIGTEARTGLICIGVLGVMLWWRMKKKVLIAVVAIAMLPVGWAALPQSFTGRMSTIKTYDEDYSASSRIAIWQWTWNYVQSHPLGCGFGCYRLNTIKVVVKGREGSSNSGGETVVDDQARAFHSSYFEVLGELGYPGILIYLSLIATALLQLRGIRRRYAGHEEKWISELALAVQRAIILYSVGSFFAGIGFQTTLYLILALAAALAQVTAGMEASVKTSEALGKKASTVRYALPARAGA